MHSGSGVSLSDRHHEQHALQWVLIRIQSDSRYPDVRQVLFHTAILSHAKMGDEEMSD